MPPAKWQTFHIHIPPLIHRKFQSGRRCVRAHVYASVCVCVCERACACAKSQLAMSCQLVESENIKSSNIHSCRKKKPFVLIIQKPFLITSTCFTKLKGLNSNGIILIIFTFQCEMYLWLNRLGLEGFSKHSQSSESDLRPLLMLWARSLQHSEPTVPLKQPSDPLRQGPAPLW